MSLNPRHLNQYVVILAAHTEMLEQMRAGLKGFRRWREPWIYVTLKTLVTGIYFKTE